LAAELGEKLSRGIAGSELIEWSREFKRRECKKIM